VLFATTGALTLSFLVMARSTAVGPAAFTGTFFRRYSRTADDSLELAAGPREDGEAEDWQREAYFEELQRNRQLRDRLLESGMALPDESVSGLDATVDEVCGIQWSESYESLANCNDAMEERISAFGEDFSQDDLAVFRVQAGHGQPELSVTLLPFYGRESAFYAMRSRAPLSGLRLRKEESGPLKSAWVVEAVSHECEDAESEVIVGDVLQAVTVISEEGSLPGRGESTRPTLADVSFIDTLDHLEEAVQRHASHASGAESILIFERDVALRSSPQEPLLRQQVE